MLDRQYVRSHVSTIVVLKACHLIWILEKALDLFVDEDIRTATYDAEGRFGLSTSF
jgi:hypothetical protein